MLSSGIVSLSSFNLLFFTQVLTVLTSTIKYNEYITDKGKNISIPCEADGSIMWIKEEGNAIKNNRTIISKGTILVLTNVSEIDKGVYVCLTTAPIEILDSSDNDTSPSNSSITDFTTTTPSTPEYNSSSNKSSTSFTNTVSFSSSDFDEDDDIGFQDFQEFLKANLSIRTTPGPVTQLYFKASTVLGFLVWRFNKTHSGGYPVKSFTTEIRQVSFDENSTHTPLSSNWSRMDPINIAPNVRQMEVYKLAPNTTYEFRIWANNYLGPGEIVTTNVTTLAETSEEDLIRLIQADIENFDPRIWVVAVAIALGTLVILTAGLCVVYCKEAHESSRSSPTSMRMGITRTKLTDFDIIVNA